MRLQQSIKRLIEKVAQLNDLCQYAARIVYLLKVTSLMFCFVSKNISLTKTDSHSRNWSPCIRVFNLDVFWFIKQ